MYYNDYDVEDSGGTNVIKKLGRSAVGVQVIKNLDFAQQPDDVEESIDVPKQ